MTDKQIEDMIYDNMPLLDVPDDLSGDAVLDLIKEYSASNIKIIRMRRILSIAASFIVVSLGLLSFVLNNRNSKMDSSFSNGNYPAETGASAPAVIDSEEKHEMYDEVEYSSSSETYMLPKDASQETSADFDDEITIIVGTQIKIQLDSCFGNNSKICYYDSEGSIVDQDSITTEIITTESDNVLVINAVKACNYTVVIEENNDIYRLNVVVLEE